MSQPREDPHVSNGDSSCTSVNVILGPDADEHVLRSLKGSTEVYQSSQREQSVSSTGVNDTDGADPAFLPRHVVRRSAMAADQRQLLHKTLLAISGKLVKCSDLWVSLGHLGLRNPFGLVQQSTQHCNIPSHRYFLEALDCIRGATSRPQDDSMVAQLHHWHGLSLLYRQQQQISSGDQEKYDKLRASLGISFTEEELSQRHDPCVREMTKALELCSDVPAVWNTMGVVMGYCGFQDKSREIFSSILQRMPHYADALHNMGWVSWVHGDVRTGMEYFQQLLADDPHHVEALNNYAGTLFQAGQPDLAAKLLEWALQQCPDLRPVRYNLALSYMELQQYERAELTLQRLMDAHSQHEDPLITCSAYLLRAQLTARRFRPLTLHYSAGSSVSASASDLGPVLKTYDMAVGIASLAPHWASLGAYLDNITSDGTAQSANIPADLTPQHLRTLARRALAKAIALSERCNVAWERYALVDLKDGRYEEALRTLKMCVFHAPLHYCGWANIALALHLLGHCAEAQECYRRAAQLHPYPVAAFNNLGCLYREEGLFELSERMFEQSMQMLASSTTVTTGSDPSSVRAPLSTSVGGAACCPSERPRLLSMVKGNLALLRLRQKRWLDAHSLLREAKQFDPHNFAAVANLLRLEQLARQKDIPEVIQRMSSSTPLTSSTAIPSFAVHPQHVRTMQQDNDVIVALPASAVLPHPARRLANATSSLASLSAPPPAKRARTSGASSAVSQPPPKPKPTGLQSPSIFASSGSSALCSSPVLRGRAGSNSVDDYLHEPSSSSTARTSALGAAVSTSHHFVDQDLDLDVSLSAALHSSSQPASQSGASPALSGFLEASQ